MKNIEGILEIQIQDAEFPKKKSGFKVYFEVSLNNQVKKSDQASGKNPKWKDKLTMDYNSDPKLHFKLLEKKTFTKDSILAQESIDLSVLKQKHKQEHFITVVSKDKLKGSVRLILVLYPYVLTPTNINPNIEEEKLLYTLKPTNEQCYIAKLLPDNKPIKLLLASFSSSNSFQNYVKRIRNLENFSVPGCCQILEIIEKLSETALYCLTIFEHKSENLLCNDIKSRQLAQEYWSEDELVNLLRVFVGILCEYEKKDLCFGEINPLKMALKPAPCLLTPGVYYKACENSSFVEGLMNEQEWQVPYLSPRIMENYVLSCKKSQTKQHCWGKSDVYSLGLVFLHMASLKSPVGLNDSEFRLAERVSAAVNSVNYSGVFKNILSLMLKVEEMERISFGLLAENLSNLLV